MLNQALVISYTELHATNYVGRFKLLLQHLLMLHEDTFPLPLKSNKNNLLAQHSRRPLQADWHSLS